MGWHSIVVANAADPGSLGCAHALMLQSGACAAGCTMRTAIA